MRADGGNDQLFGKEGNDFLIGGEGDDTVFFMGEKSHYTIIEYGTSVVMIDSEFGRDGLDKLVSIERYSFIDGAFQLSELLDTQDVAEGIYRFFNVEIGTHFFTQSTVERDSVINNLDAFNFEGPTFRAADPTNAAADTVFRFFNTQTGTHFYTAAEAEKDSIIENLPTFNFEGTAYWVDPVMG